MPRFKMYPLRANNILDLYRQRDAIDLEPPYQRLAVWDRAKRQRFIDSVINEVDTPKLYFHELTRIPGSESQFRYSVIDGKQRMLALWEFMDNRLALPDDFVFFDDDSRIARGMSYSRLLEQYPLLRARFDRYAAPIVLVQADRDELIEQLFSRLNVQVPLSAPESRNVLGGPVPFLIRKIGLTPFFRRSVRIKNNRFQHYDLAAKFVYICYRDSFVPTKKADLDGFVKAMKLWRARGDVAAGDGALRSLETRTKDLLHGMHNFFGHDNSLLRSVGRVTLYFHMFRLCYKNSVDLSISVPMLRTFNTQVTRARRKSQRMGGGSGEDFSDIENVLVLFDREKQSVNDGRAIARQYEHMRIYMAERFDVSLPEPGVSTATRE